MTDKFDFSDYVDTLISEHEIDVNSSDFLLNFTKFLSTNGWFGAQPEVSDSKVFLDAFFIEKAREPIENFCRNYSQSDAVKFESICNYIWPKTAQYLLKYIKSKDVQRSWMYYPASFLAYHLPCEISEMTDPEIAMLLDEAFDVLKKQDSERLTDFINWLHLASRTVYNGTYTINEYKKRDVSAYDPEKYLSILYHLYNERYIMQNAMYGHAAESKNFCDTWLFLALHFICALRSTDLVQLPHPKLYSSPDEVLKKIAAGTFTDTEAKSVLYSITWTIEAFLPVPHKTKSHKGIGGIKFVVPTSVQTLIGTLFAAAEAHFLIKNGDAGDRDCLPLIRVITTYEEISRYMGEEIGELFLDSNFSTRAANKSYMQMIYLLTDDILEGDDMRTKGYMLAALARSHKGSYGTFAKTTATYLKDAKMSGYTPDYVARELFERGVLSAIPSMLLCMITDGEYQTLSIHAQTLLIKSLGLSPLECEKSVSTLNAVMKQSIETVKSLYKFHSKEEILGFLHKIGDGEAVSRFDDLSCLMTAMGIACPYQETKCRICEYRILTESTLFLMVREFVRQTTIYNTSSDPLIKDKCLSIAQGVILPAIEEILSVVENEQGIEAVASLEKIIMEMINHEKRKV